MRRLLDRVYGLVLRHWPIVLIAVALLLLAMRLHWSMRVVAATVFVVGALLAIAGAVLALYDLATGRQSEPKFLVRLRLRAQQARERIVQLEGEVAEIDQKVEQLRGLSARPDAEGSGQQYGKSLELIRGYGEERELRATKLAFYQRSHETLRRLERKWQQERRLKGLERDLDRLRRPREQDASEMTSLRGELAYEQRLLKTYQQLSRQLDEADTVASARELRTDLDRLLE